MSRVTGAYVRTCQVCGGNGGHWPRATRCAPCLGSGQTVVCSECGHDMPRPEAEEHGAACGTCRDASDIPLEKAS